MLGKTRRWSPCEQHLHDASLVVHVLREAAQREGRHLLQLHVAAAEHGDERGYRPALHNLGLELVVCRGKLAEEQGRLALALRAAGRQQPDHRLQRPLLQHLHAPAHIPWDTAESESRACMGTWISMTGQSTCCKGRCHAHNKWGGCCSLPGAVLRSVCSRVSQSLARHGSAQSCTGAPGAWCVWRSAPGCLWRPRPHSGCPHRLPAASVWAWAAHRTPLSGSCCPRSWTPACAARLLLLAAPAHWLAQLTIGASDNLSPSPG